MHSLMRRSGSILRNEQSEWPRDAVGRHCRLAQSREINTGDGWSQSALEATWKEIPPALGHKEYVAFAAYSPNAKTLATACSDGRIKLWDVASRHEVASLQLGLSVWQIMFSPDDQTLAARSWEGLLRVWRAPRSNEARL